MSIKIMGSKVWSFPIFVLIFCVLVVDCIPTSVMVDSKETSSLAGGLKKVKRTPSESTASKPVSDEKMPAGLEALHQKYAPKKRGAPYQLYNTNTDVPTDSAINVPNGYWEDINTPVVYPDLSEADYQQEPLALPLQYSSFYGDRKKRSNANKKNVGMGKKAALAAIRPKRQSTKISPAEMLALMELVSAQKQQRPHYDGSDTGINLPYDFLLPQQQLQQTDEEGEWLDGWAEPAVEYYGLANSPYTDESSLGPRYNLDYPNRKVHPSKRFMVSKKKRTNGGRYQPNYQPQYQSQYDPLIDNLAFAYDYGRFGEPVDEPKGHYKYF